MGDALDNRSDSGDDSQPGCVLIVDDNEALRRALMRNLRARGYEVLETGDGSEAAALLDRHPVDVVVSDIRMPDMDGVELLRIVHERDPDMPVLLMTGAPELETAMKAVEYGAFEYVLKPLDPVNLAASVARAVRQRRVANARSEVLRSAEHPSDSGPIEGIDRIWTGALLGGRYRVGEMIGEGGMGSVYEATREDLGKMRVAIKVLHPALASREELMLRFRREAEVIATINHPNIVKILDFYTAPNQPTFLVMELLQGATLSQSIEDEGRFAQNRVAFIASQMLGALAAAHSANVIHRDLKPENVFLTTMSGLSDIVKLLDFGVAKLTTDTDQKLTRTGHVVGTPAYMAPEYARGRSIDERSDIYGVGCVIYEALAGREPFTADNYNALLYEIQEGTPEPLRELRPDLAPALTELVEKAMAKDPAARFQTAEEMARALEPWVLTPSKTPDSLPRSGPMTSAPTEFASVLPDPGSGHPRRK